MRGIISGSQDRGIEIKAVKVDLYEAQGKEVVWLGDGICVSEQKKVRDKRAKRGKERTTSEIGMLGGRDGSYRTIIAGEGVDRVQLYKAQVIEEYGEEASRLPVVAITDGARSLKREVKEVFGEEVSHILDWYNLGAKVYQLMTQIAANKKVREESQGLIIGELWCGMSERAIKCLEEVETRNEVKRDELKGYLEKTRAILLITEKEKKRGK